MRDLSRFILSFLRREDGATLIEYTILLSFVTGALAFGFEMTASRLVGPWAATDAAWVAPSPPPAVSSGGPIQVEATPSGQGKVADKGNNGWGNGGHDGGEKKPEESR